VFLTVLLVFTALCLAAQTVPYSRPVETAPQQETIGNNYQVPPVQRPLPRAHWLQILDVVLLAGFMAAAVEIVLRRRRRKALQVLSLAALAYFGFYREGCVCPIGSIQNVALAFTDPHYSIPIVVTLTFFLPLAAALFVGRAFCGGVCALGAIQELVLIRPVAVPRKLDRALGWLKYIYLAAALFFVLQPAIRRDFIICRFDPFVGLFRRTGAPHMIIAGALFLAAGMFVGRPYCRYLCPYGGLLSWCARLAKRGVTITPDKELDCGLCTGACPYGAIEKMRAVRRDCLYCARCYRSCPRGRS
jgi:hypothetical protein